VKSFSPSDETVFVNCVGLPENKLQFTHASSLRMKDILQKLSAYNLWANSQLFPLICQLPKEKQEREIPSSFPSLYRTILHMWDAETIWWQRFKLQERLIIPSENFKGDMNELCQQLLKQDKLWSDWLSSAQEHMLTHVFHYQTLKKEQFKQPVYEMMLHVFNHGTYHRGQLVNMLRQLGVEKIPATDFSIFTRKK
jgi:uncharacterized damage-inducible protein DinB